jgi:hypothetical protein
MLLCKQCISPVSVFVDGIVVEFFLCPFHIIIKIKISKIVNHLLVVSVVISQWLAAEEAILCHVACSMMLYVLVRNNYLAKY